jgi:hypothetical protein
MQVAQAKRIARDWVLDEGSRLPGFIGAYFAGSVNWLPDEAALPPASDLDVNLVFGGDDPLPARHKLNRDGVLIEISHLPLDRLRSPEQVLGDFALAGGFRVPSVILDPTGHLAALQAVVSRDFADSARVRRRCEQAEKTLHAYLDGPNEAAPLHRQIIGWVFGTSVTALLPLIAALRNPTVRRRYVAVRELLAERGRLDLYELLLELLGCAAMRRAQVEHHLAALAEVYDSATSAIRSPFPFAADVSALTRPIAIDGSRDLIERGLHREAVFWLVVTHGRCQEVLAVDAPWEAARFTPACRDLLADLGVASFAGRRQRAEQVKALLPQIWAVVDEIIASQ